MKIFKVGLLLCAFVYSSVKSHAQITPSITNEALSSNSIEEFCKTQPDAVNRLFQEVNLAYPGLEKVQKAKTLGNWTAACKELVNYYKGKEKNDWLISTNYELESNPLQISNDALIDSFTFQGVKGKVKRSPNSMVNWHDKGPNQDLEWGWFLNRHFFLNDLTVIYLKSQDPRYSILYNNLIKDWILSNPTFLKETHNLTWRPLEVGIRAGRSWIKRFTICNQLQNFRSYLVY